MSSSRAAAAVNDLLVEARQGVETLKRFLMQLDHHRAPWAALVADGVLIRLSNVMSALDGGAGVAAGGGQSPAAPQPSASSSGNKKKRSFSKRSYFRCTHKSDQGCNAKRYVQVCEADPCKHVVTYFGKHTCRDPSKIPLAISAAGANAVTDHGGASNLISFAPSRTDAAASTGGVSSQQLAMMDGNGAAAGTQLSISWCTSDDVFSSSAGSFMQVDGLGAVVGSAAVTTSVGAAAAGSAPDNGGMMPWPGGGGLDTGSFPSSPNRHGFVGGDDDDFFPLDHP